MRAALRPFKLPADATVTIAFIDDAAMRALNRSHRAKDRTTDVLSFGQELPAGVKGADAASRLRREVDGALEVGDIVMSETVARRQAKRRRWTLAKEVGFLAVHGALHLLGYEDETPAGHREMVRLGTEAVGVAVSRRRARAGRRA